MNKESEACIGCPVIETCPPQRRADRIIIGINQGTMPPQQRSSQLSMLRQEISRYNCPPCENVRLAEPLVKLIHPSRNRHFNAKIAPSHSTPDVGYVTDESARTGKLFSITKGVKAKRTTR